MTPKLSASYEFCRRVARREARNFYPTFLLLPADRRRSMCALYAFMRNTDDIADAEPEGGPDANRRAFLDWRERLDQALEGAPAGPGEWPGWPALADTAGRRAIPPRYLRDVLDGVEMDLAPRPVATFDELDRYCYHVAGAVGLCCIHIWGFDSDGGRAEALAVRVGRALQLTNIIRDVGEDARLGRAYLPAEDLERFSVRADDLTAGRTGGPLRSLLAFEAARAYDDYEAVKSLAPLVDPVGRPVLRAIAGVYRALLDEIARRRYDVLSGRASVPSWRKAAVVAGALAGRFLPDPNRSAESSRRR